MPERRILPIAIVLGTTVFLVAAALFVGFDTNPRTQSIPLAERSYALGDDLATYDSLMMSGGTPPDDIPSIHRPQFVSASAARLAPGDLVIGFLHAGEARAYPQKILVYHEILDDQVGGLNVAITHCPLTATAQEGKG